ncbi:LicD family protein [Vibrio fluvialis]|nr:LicD family protein [Vibrio fluvialis]
MQRVNEKLLRKGQLAMLSILIEVDKICRDNNIEYWLDAGTLLGAVRHKGFIPWDDDIDICMRRVDYNNFIEVSHLLPDWLYIQIDGGKYYRNGNSPCKVRSKGTHIKELSDSNMNVTNLDDGIFVDIFPVDKFHSNPFIRRIQRAPALFYYLKLSGYFLKHKSTLRFIIAKFASLVPWSIYKSISEFTVCSSEKIQSNYKLGFGVDTMLGYLGYTDESDLYPLTKLEFEGHEFYVPKNYHIWLIERYGIDYMEMPPESKRRWHAVEIKMDKE